MAGLISECLAWPNLCNAWERVADNRGAPGIDGVSIRRYARHWEANLRTQRDLIWTNRYKPAKLRRVAIPKRSGGQRLLSIPTVADRILQRAVLNIIDDLFEREFLPCSFGYRTGRSIKDALKALLRYRDRRLTQVLDADIDECFDSLHHDLLLQFLDETVSDSSLMRLIALWLHRGRRYRNPDRGIPLGMPLSPLCCNAYLHRLDSALVRNRWALVRYADDFVVCCASEFQAQRAQRLVETTLESIGLQLEPTKTSITSFKEGFDFLGIRFERDSYTFLYREKEIEVSGPVPHWLWGYVPRGYQG